MTNLEWYKKKIANMSIEEFVQILANPDDMFDCNMCHLYIDNECRATSSEECFDGITRWLKSNYTPACHVEEKQETVTKVHMMCSCGGEYFPVTETECSTWIKHACTKCGHVMTFERAYPYLNKVYDQSVAQNIIAQAKIISQITNPFEGDF